MTYIVDTHILIWFLDKNKRLKPLYHQILTSTQDNFVFSTMVLAEIKHLIFKKRINIDFEKVLNYLGESENCIIYPVDEDVVENMPEGLDIHDALIVATGLVYKNILGENVKILTEDKEIIKCGILPGCVAEKNKKNEEQKVSNIETGLLYENLKSRLKPSLENLEDIEIAEGDKYLEARNRANSNKFVFHISKTKKDPIYPTKDYLGVYIEVAIPLFFNGGVLLEPILEQTYENEYATHYVLDKLKETERIYTEDDAMNLALKYYSIFQKAYTSKNLLIKTLISNFFSMDKGSINFEIINVNFLYNHTDKFLYYFDEKNKTVFLDDISGTNIKSIINGIEEVATTIYHTKIAAKRINPEEIKWINFFLNLNNDGIIAQEIKIIPVYTGLLFRTFKKYEYPDFYTKFFIEKNKIKKIWEEIVLSRDNALNVVYF